MKVNIGPIRELRGGIINFQGEIKPPDFKMEINFTSPLKVNGMVTNTGEGFLVQAQVDFDYQVNCSRCLKEFLQHQQIEVTEGFLTGTSKETDDLVYYFTGDIIDLKDCLTEQVLLSLPMSFICQPDCRGLCSNCGHDLNKGECSCLPEQVNPQFEKLRNLLSIEGGGVNGKSKK